MSMSAQQPKQAYQAFSPPPPVPGGQPLNGKGNGNGFSPMSSGQSQSQRFQQYPSPASPVTGGQYSRQPRYQGQPQPNGAGYASSQVPQQQQQRPYKGTLAPGTMVQVGENQVRVEKYLSEGGYAHVYLTRSEPPIYPPAKGDKKGRWGERGFTEHCLKRIAFEDDSVWIDVKKEIEVMVRQVSCRNLIWGSCLGDAC